MTLKLKEKAFKGLKFKCSPCDGSPSNLNDPTKIDERMHMRLSQSFVSKFLSISFLGVAFFIDMFLSVTPATLTWILGSVVLWLGCKKFLALAKKLYCREQNLKQKLIYNKI